MYDDNISPAATRAANTTGRSFKAEAVSNKEIIKDHYVLLLKPLGNPPSPKPGQFYMIATANATEPLLKRPFCVFNEQNSEIALLYRVAGKGTARLRDMPAGCVIDVLGPLGNHYPAPKRGMTPVVIAGGTGLASIFPFINSHKSIVIYGARTSVDLMMTLELKSMSDRLIITTEDGTSGMRGNVIDALKSLKPGEDNILYVCGPRAMAAAAAGYAKDNGLNGYVSMEEFMACGIGACMGCVVNTVKGYKRVCKEGPVFRLDEIIW